MENDNKNIVCGTNSRYIPKEVVEKANENFLNRMKDLSDDLSYDEALCSIIHVMDTPILRRKNSDDINHCVDIVKRELINKGKWIM